MARGLEAREHENYLSQAVGVGTRGEAEREWTANVGNLDCRDAISAPSERAGYARRARGRRGDGGTVVLAPRAFQASSGCHDMHTNNLGN